MKCYDVKRDVAREYDDESPTLIARIGTGGDLPVIIDEYTDSSQTWDQRQGELAGNMKHLQHLTQHAQVRLESWK